MKRTITIAALAFLTYLCCSAVVAKPGPRIIEQPNGDTLTVYAFGDQHFHWMENDKGEWIEQGEDGVYRTVKPLDAKQIEARRQQSASYQGMQRAKASHKAMKKAPSPLNIAPRGLVILANFADQSFITDKEEVTEMINGDHYVRDYSYIYRMTRYDVHSEGSARQYFIDQSMGQYQPEFDVVGPYTVDKNTSYYGSNNDARAYQLIIDVCQLADEDGVDFSRYDCDNDGIIDFVYVLYAGYGEADGGASYTIWPHTYYIRDAVGKSVLLDGKYLNTYACANELEYLSKQHSGIGTFVHEFSHVLGLPDLYATNNSSHKTIGDWDIMDTGPYNNSGNTPPAFSAYERFFCGWLNPTILNSPKTITVDEIQTSNRAYLITETGESNLIGNNPNPTTFYLLENRQLVGWDEYLPGHGMLITKIKYDYASWSNNMVNNSAPRMGVDMIEADGKAPANSYGKPTDAFPAGSNEFTPFEQYPITDIEETLDGQIVFKFMGGSDWLSAMATEQATITDKKGREYTTVYAIYDINGELQYLTEDGKEFYSDWQSSDLEIIKNVSEITPGTYILVVSDEGEGKANHRRGVKVTIQ